MFKVPENKKITDLEADVLKLWKEKNIFEKSVESRPENNAYVFYDGPPFVSGLPHYGHILSSIAKDIIPRYWTMKGKRVERLWGWDAHGLTVENRVQKKLDIKNRRDIESFGLEKFIEECYTYTSETSAEWDWYIDRIGRWVDIENAYRTTDQDYMESVMWVFKQLFDKGLIYEGVRTSLFCTTCGTPVSNFEIAMDNTYKDVEDPSVTVKFPITSDGDYKGANILAWTTTPWTLPSNRGLVLDPKADYVLAKFDDEDFIVAKDAMENVFGEDSSAQIAKTFKGSELLGLEYSPPYDFFEKTDKDFKVYEFEGMVSMEEGTGIVHSAPGFGEIDTEMGYHHSLRIMLVIDDEGKFGPGDAGENPFEGMYYAKANKFIRKDLNERELMFKDEVITHRFPYHDRCNTLLIQKAQNSWFVNVQELKPTMLENNKNINWVPENLKEGRFKHVVETAPDWCISRARFWATPMPVWRSEDGDTIVVGSIEELEELSGQKVKDLHRPYIDEIKIEKDGKVYTRIPDVLDSWFEAGSMPYGQMHYPFENQVKFDANFPGDYIIEYIAQVRAWFNVMLRLSAALFGRNSFKNVISTGILYGNDGRKMSKSYGNYADPKEILENIGGDALRLFFMNSPLMIGENANFDEVELRNKSRNVLNPLWNSLKFFLIYANFHNWKPKSAEMPSSDNVLDQWIVARLHETIRDFSTNIEKYLVPSAVQPIEDFVDDLSRWYVRRSRDRIAAGDENALATFYYVLSTFSLASAPIIPFMTDAMYQELLSGGLFSQESVHLEDYPEFDDKVISSSEKNLEDMQLTRDLVSAALSVRVAAKVPVRQPLANLRVLEKSKVSNEYLQIIKDEVNVKEVEFVDSLDKFDEATLDIAKTVSLDLAITEELQIEGQAREMIRQFQSMRKKLGLSVNDRIVATYESSPQTDAVVKAFEKEISSTIQADKIEKGDEFNIAKI